MNESDLRGKGRCHMGLWMVIGHGRVANPFHVFPYRSRIMGAPVLALFARAGTMRPEPCVFGT